MGMDTHTCTHRDFPLDPCILSANRTLQHLPKVNSRPLKCEGSQVGAGTTCLGDGFCQAAERQEAQKGLMAPFTDLPHPRGAGTQVSFIVQCGISRVAMHSSRQAEAREEFLRRGRRRRETELFSCDAGGAADGDAGQCLCACVCGWSQGCLPATSWFCFTQSH